MMAWTLQTDEVIVEIGTYFVLIGYRILLSLRPPTEEGSKNLAQLSNQARTCKFGNVHETKTFSGIERLGSKA
jgi:hypothetical protein